MNLVFVVAVIWTWHAFWMLLLTYAIGRAAHTHTGWPVCKPESCRIIGGRKCKWRVFKWPVAGRWLLTALCFMVTLMIADIAKLAWEVYANDYPNRIDWQYVLVRALPIWIEPWTFWRQWRVGLTNDDALRGWRPK